MISGRSAGGSSWSRWKNRLAAWYPATVKPDVVTFDQTNLPADGWQWRWYRKKVAARMVRIDGPFEVLTSEGPSRCDDGYLAIDARGYPYPIAAAAIAPEE